MLMLCSASAWQSLPSVPGRSSKRIENSLLVGMWTSLQCPSGMGRELPARSNDDWNPTPATRTHSRLLLAGTASQRLSPPPRGFHDNHDFLPFSFCNSYRKLSAHLNALPYSA